MCTAAAAADDDDDGGDDLFHTFFNKILSFNIKMC